MGSMRIGAWFYGWFATTAGSIFESAERATNGHINQDCDWPVMSGRPPIVGFSLAIESLPL